MRIPSVAKLGLIAALFIGFAAAITPAIFTMDSRSRITEEQAKSVLSALRASLKPKGPQKLPSDLEAVSRDKIPLVLTIRSNGIRNRVLQVDGKSLETAFAELVKTIKGLDVIDNGQRVRLQLDLITSTGWMPKDGIFAVLALVEGRDGISGLVDDQRVYLPPSELIRNKKYGSFLPLPDYDTKFRIGIDIEKTKKTIRHQGTRIGIRGDEVTKLARFRTLSVVEGEDLVPRRLLKGTVDRPDVTRSRVHAAVLAGAKYLKDALGPDGIYHYYYNPVLNRDERGDYNWPRHAGVSYSLALVGRLMKKPEFIAAAKRALDRFEEQLAPGPGDSKCLMSNGKCYLGSSALGLLALAEYRIASQDSSFDDIAHQVARFLMSMQKDDRFFYHDWYPKRGIDKELMKLYASQQAVFALARYGKAMGNKEAITAAVRGMDYLAGPYWDHFLGSFFFGQEHWTCLAAEEVYSIEPKPEYAELCHGIGIYYDNISHNQGDTPFKEDVGGMCVTHLFTPHIGGTATASEAMVSAVLLGNAIGKDTVAIREQLKASFGFLIRGQVTIHDTFWIKHHNQALGGFYETQSKTKIRIDTVQHAISAMARGLDLLP